MEDKEQKGKEEEGEAGPYDGEVSFESGGRKPTDNQTKRLPACTSTEPQGSIMIWITRKVR